MAESTPPPPHLPPPPPPHGTRLARAPRRRLAPPRGAGRHPRRGPVAPPPLFPLRGHRPASTDPAQSGHVGRGIDHLAAPARPPPAPWGARTPGGRPLDRTQPR